MSRSNTRLWTLRKRTHGPTGGRHPLRPNFDVLENRQLLATTGLAPMITVGRVLSAYAVGDVQNNQLTETLTVYNEQSDTETGVLLTDTLATGVLVAERVGSAGSERAESGLEFAGHRGL